MAPARGHGPLQAHHPGPSCHHGPQDLGIVPGKVPPAARPHQHRHHPRCIDPRRSERRGRNPVSSPEEALQVARASDGAEEIWVIGGGEIYAALAPKANLAIVTVINDSLKGDTTAPALDSAWTKAIGEPDNGWLKSANGTEYRIEAWERGA